MRRICQEGTGGLCRGDALPCALTVIVITMATHCRARLRGKDEPLGGTLKRLPSLLRVLCENPEIQERGQSIQKKHP